MSLRSAAHPFLGADEALAQPVERQEEYETTPLHYAAATGNSETLGQYLQPAMLAQIDVDGPDQQGKTALIYAVAGDHVACAALLLQAGAQVLAQDSDTRTPVHWAAFHGRHRILKLLLEHGGDPLLQDNEGRTALHLSTGAESSKCTKLLVKYMDAAGVNLADSEQMTAAHWSSFHDHAKHLDLLVAAGADLMLADGEGRIPLHWAATNPTQITCNLILVSQPQCINATDREGRTALHLAVANNNIGIVDILTSADNCDVSAIDHMHRTPLHWAAVLGHASLATLLLQRGASSTVADDNGATAMHYAAQLDVTDALLSIVSFPGVADTPDAEGRTALMWAAGKGQANAIEILAVHNADLQAFDKTAGTALHIAAFSGHADAARVLLKYGATVDALDSAHHTPLFRACEAGHVDVVALFLGAGALVDQTDNEGRTPLHWAALGGFVDICVLLVQARAGVDPLDGQGRTPLHCATYGGHLACIELLLRLGSNVSSQDNEGITALHWACSIGSIDAVRLLLQSSAFPNHMEVDGEKLTPLDYATMGELKGELRDEIVDMLVQHGALSIASIKEMAATSIQAWWRGVTVRRKTLLRKPQALPPLTAGGLTDVIASSTAAVESLRDSSLSSILNEAVQASGPAKLMSPNSLASQASASRTASTPRRWQQSPARVLQSPTRVLSQRRSSASGHTLTANPGTPVNPATPVPAATPGVRLFDEDRVADLPPRLSLRPSSACRLEILHHASTLKRHAMSEQARLAGIRRMVEAAMIIQLTWRRYQLRKRRLRARAIAAATEAAQSLVIHVRASPPLPSPLRPLELANNAKLLPEDLKNSWRHQIAALTIQLAWRQHRRRKLARLHQPKPAAPKDWTPSVLAQKQRQRVTEIYGKARPLAPVRPPHPQPMVRPAYMRTLIPAAVLSYTSALGSYTQPPMRTPRSSAGLSTAKRTPRPVGRSGALASSVPTLRLPTYLLHSY